MILEKVDLPKDIIREFFKNWPRLYYLIASVFGPLWLTGLSPTQFLKEYQRTGKILNIGSGPKKIAENVVNVDIYPYEGVEVISSLTELSLGTESAGMIVCDTVLEHVPNPVKAVSEIHRVLERGGVAYVSVPFLYPFHASPFDYTRWTEQGVRTLFADFEILEIGVRAGMFSALSSYLCYFIPSFLSLGSDKLYWLFVNVSLLIFFPIKFLDIFAAHLPYATRTAAVLYCVARKSE